jgi:hypothetical protein
MESRHPGLQATQLDGREDLQHPQETGPEAASLWEKESGAVWQTLKIESKPREEILHQQMLHL